MALLKIARMGHPVLRRRCDPIEVPDDPELARLARDMVETMLDAPGVGLAAPQVHAAVRMIVYHVPAERADEEGPGEVAPRVLVNPVLTAIGDRLVGGLEGCLSIPGLRGIVPRHETVHWAALDLMGRPIEGEAAGFEARILQHEVDHLDGVLYLDRMIDPADLAFDSEIGHLLERMEARR